jgi:hypothetical protein
MAGRWPEGQLYPKFNFSQQLVKPCPFKTGTETFELISLLLP